MRRSTHSAVVALLSLAGCSERDRTLPFSVPDPEILRPARPKPPAPPAPGDELFDPDRILEIDLFTDPEDWTRIEAETLDLSLFSQPDCQAAPFPEPTFYRGTAVIDRAIVENVGLRQHGFIYQLNEYVPPLEIRFDQYDPDQRFLSRRHLLLESVVADPTSMRACLAYRVFEAAGVPSPRCSFAAVRVNGVDKGIYAHVEPIDADFVEARLGMAAPLFEGKASDFREGWMATFEGPADRAPLLALEEALTATDDRLIERVSAVVDLDAFDRFWAVETVIGHFNGYAGNADRFFVAAHPERGLVFLPSAPETAFTPGNDFLRGPQPASVYAQGELARRLYLTPEGRHRHLDAVQAVLDGAWDENALVAEINRMEALIGPRLWRTPDLQAQVQDLRGFVRSRRDAIEAELPAGADWMYSRRPTFCLVPRGAIEAGFETRWGTLPTAGDFGRIFETGTATLSTTFDDISYLQLSPGGTAAGATPEGQAVFVSIAPTGFSTNLVLYVVMDPAQVAPGTFSIDNVTVFGQVAYYDARQLPVWTAYLYGTLELPEARTEPGARVTGRVTADLY